MELYSCVEFGRKIIRRMTSMIILTKQKKNPWKLNNDYMARLHWTKLQGVKKVEKCNKLLTHSSMLPFHWTPLILGLQISQALPSILHPCHVWCFFTRIVGGLLKRHCLLSCMLLSLGLMFLFVTFVGVNYLTNNYYHSSQQRPVSLCGPLPPTPY